MLPIARQYLMHMGRAVHALPQDGEKGRLCDPLPALLFRLYPAVR